MTRSDAGQREERRLRQLAAKYREDGFEVMVRPRDDRLPPFLRGLTPDLIASKGGKHIIIEVKTRESLPQDEQLTELAAAIKGREGWEFELVLTNPRTPNDTSPQGVVSANIASGWLFQAEKLNEDFREAAFMLAWMAFEAVTQDLITKQLDAPARHAPQNLPKTAFSLGFVNRRQLKTLEESQQLRNLLVHGVFVYVSDDQFQEFLDVVRDLVDEATADE